MATPLPTFKGYSVDFRLREFRIADAETGKIEFISFQSDQGDDLLAELIETTDDKELKQQAVAAAFGE
jgi:hypothetical protein